MKFPPTVHLLRKMAEPISMVGAKLDPEEVLMKMGEMLSRTARMKKMKINRVNQKEGRDDDDKANRPRLVNMSFQVITNDF